MKLFKDNAGTEWKISVTLDLVEQLRDALGVDLLDSSGEVFERLSSDLFLLGRVLWRCCEKQAVERGVTPEQFVAAVAGDPFDAAAVALTEAVADFFPSRRRLLLQRANATTRSVREKAENLALAKLNDPALEARLEAAMVERMEADLEAALTRLSSAGS